MFQIGDIEIHIVNDGRVMVDGGGPFGLVPRKLWSRYLKPAEDNLVPMDLNCLLVKTAGQHILVDTGLGSKLDQRMIDFWQLTRPNGSLLDGLSRLGLTAEDIDLVIDTHLHADHCSGNTLFSPEMEIVPSFPNAKYVVQRREYEDAMHPNERTRATYYPINYETLVNSGQMELLDGDTEIMPGIRGVVTPGHTPAHMSVVFESGGEYALFLCDLASFMINFERLGWMTAYDVEPLVTLETKRIWQKWALETNALLLSAHDTLIPAGHLRQDDRGNLKVDPVEVAFV
ncbi:MAG: MBL fold metallo-hydrolase [Anaerolineae bacterium]|nr:MBL fold metallo-hydrolase [Anaerolineae bacterium]